MIRPASGYRAASFVSRAHRAAAPTGQRRGSRGRYVAPSGALGQREGCDGQRGRDAVSHRRSRVHWVERGRQPERGRAQRYRRERPFRQRREMAQPRQAAAGRRGAARRPCELARQPQARRRHPPGRNLRNHRDRRRPRARNQFPSLAAAARLVRGDAHTIHLCIVGRDLRRWRSRFRRRRDPVGARAAAAAQSLRLEQAPVRPGGGGARRQASGPAAAMGGT